MQENNKINKLTSTLKLEEFEFNKDSASTYYTSNDYKDYIFEYNPKKKRDIVVHKRIHTNEEDCQITHRKYLQTRILQIANELTREEAFQKLDNLINQELNLNHLDEKSIDFKLFKNNIKIMIESKKPFDMTKSDLKRMDLNEFKKFIQEKTNAITV